MENQTRQDLIDEKTACLADLDRDAVARDLTAEDRQRLRRRVRQIQTLLAPLSRHPRRVFMMP